ncbi:hypothetical protein ON010_g4990 [Phytophthora cinnamomi]|nr:hypothetical protein ON010_g4990 [Phytophthora cinnamomi]
MCKLYCRQVDFQKRIDRDTDDENEKTNSVPSFEKQWRAVDKAFPAPQKFVGGLATTFPGTATGESDFRY